MVNKTGSQVQSAWRSDQSATGCPVLWHRRWMVQRLVQVSLAVCRITRGLVQGTSPEWPDGSDFLDPRDTTSVVIRHVRLSVNRWAAVLHMLLPRSRAGHYSFCWPQVHTVAPVKGPLDVHEV